MKIPTLRPPLKWAGGKQRLLPTLLPHLPREGRLIEPFVGAGSVFMNAGDRPLYINDLNQDLVAMYEILRDRPAEYIQRAQSLFTEGMLSPSAYLAARSAFNAATDTMERASLLLYLNRFGFNGLYRVNRRGEYNVPYGHLKKLPSLPLDRLVTMSAKLQDATITNFDFREVMRIAESGDVVYCDPPYASPASNSMSFTGYTAGGFTHADQAELAVLAHEAATRGATVIISNHDTPEMRDLYRGMEIHSVEVRRSVAASADRRGTANELIAVLR